MNKHRIFSTFAAGLLLIAGVSISTAQARDVKYNYIEGRYVLDAEADNNIDGDGILIGGSFRLNKDFYAFGSYEALDLDFGNDVDTLAVGAGYIYPLNTKWDANFSLSLVNVDVNSNDDNGFSLAAGIRGMLMPNIEGRATLTYIDVNDDDTFITLAGDYFFSTNLSVGLEIDLAGDLETVSIGARYYF
jgi:opacity protein-like surface antigen